MEIDTTVIFGIRAPHRYCRECNALLKDYGGKKHLIHPFGTLVSDVWTDIYRIRHSKRRDEHPCQLPVHLLERLILMTTDAGDTVLDPFIGTGTTAIAAKRLGRQYIGIDIDEKYVEISRQKLEETSPTRIYNRYVSIFLGKIVTVRDLDYKDVESSLMTRELKINSHRSKQLTLPTIVKSRLVYKAQPEKSLDETMLKDITQSPQNKEFALQANLLEEKKPYVAEDKKDTQSVKKGVIESKRVKERRSLS